MRMQYKKVYIRLKIRTDMQLDFLNKNDITHPKYLSKQNNEPKNTSKTYGKVFMSS